MPTISVDLENDIYTNLVCGGVDIEKEFKNFLLQSELVKRFKKNQSLPNYWDALNAEIEAIKKINNKIFHHV